MKNPDGRITGRESTAGRLYLTFVVPCARTKDNLHHLLCALEAWRKSNSDQRIDDLIIVRQESVVIGLDVSYSATRPDEPLLSFDLIEPVLKKYGMEYMEALMQDATAHYLSQKINDPVVVMLSRRHIAILVYQDCSRGYILVMDILLSTLNPYEAKYLKEAFDKWSSGNKQGYLVHVLPVDFSPLFVDKG